MKNLTLRMPAKTILFGEYGVLSGGKAVALTFFNPFFELFFVLEPCAGQGNVTVQSDFFLEKKISFGLQNVVLAEKNLNQDQLFFIKLLQPWSGYLQKFNFLIEIRKSFSPALGFGSSSALIAGISKALWQFFFPAESFLTNVDFWSKVRESLRHVQGVGSGYDIAVQLAASEEQTQKNQFWIFQNQEKNPVPKIEKFEPLEQNKYGIFIATQIYSHTKNEVNKFQFEQRKDEFAQFHRECAQSFIDNSSLKNTKILMQKAKTMAFEQNLFPMDDFSVQTLLSSLEEQRIPYKTLGAGHGDCLWAFLGEKEFYDMKSRMEKGAHNFNFDLSFSFERRGEE